ncbi:MAG: hypothetical protein AMR96_07015 [Candidatus Adiutrix intracellularis]|nr:MAG: hypothetical protein AMR96_07015 [Candidatus Adiutrix intracellularis]
MIDHRPWLPLQGQMSSRLDFEVLLRDFTTFRVGGAAGIMARPEKSGELRTLVNLARELGLPVLVLGGGSNLLFSDSGFAGLVIKLGRSFATIENLGGGRILVGAAAAVLELLAWAWEKELGGLECLAGVPGTVGGALAGNSGIGGQTVGRIVNRLFILGEDGEAKVLKETELKFSSRRLFGLSPEAVILGAEFNLKPRPKIEIRSNITEALERRHQTQPLGERSAGCVFKNPPGQSAGRIIEECGFKGYVYGGARVSEIHANFIIARAGATCADILTLMELIRRGVSEKYGLLLEPEIRIIGPTGEVGHEMA